jgi:hypothetical protein
MTTGEQTRLPRYAYKEAGQYKFGKMEVAMILRFLIYIIQCFSYLFKNRISEK